LSCPARGRHTVLLKKMKHSRLNSQRFTILELLDRLLDKGVVVKGEILLSVADIDLVYLNLGLLLSSVKTVEKATQLISWQTSSLGGILNEPQPELGRKVIARTLPSFIDHGLDQVFAPKANIDPKNVEKGLAKLVLTLVDLIRKLMEKQAVRRMDGGFLTAGEVERMGNAFFLLDDKMVQLKKTFALKDEDLNLDLGPLGELI